MNICVFCASSNQISKAFFEAANQLGEGLAKAGHQLIYGGGRVGLMGAVATSVHQHGGKVIGVIPKSLARREVAYYGADELVVTADMLTRKHELMTRSDLFLALPGGLGTLDEILEVITHAQLGYHDKPTLLINIHGYFDAFHQYLVALKQQGMIRQDLDKLYRCVDDVPACLAELANR